MKQTVRKETKRNIREQKPSDVKGMVIAALFVALVYVFTAFINIRLPIGGNGGLIHLGNIPLFLAAMIFGKRTGCVAGALGMGLFDVLSGWASWAPFTVIIVGLMGYTVGVMTENKEKYKILWYFLAVVAACGIKVVGYYFAEVILYGNLVAPFASIPGNVIQVSFAGMVTLLVVDRLKSAAVKVGLVKGQERACIN